MKIRGNNQCFHRIVFQPDGYLWYFYFSRAEILSRRNADRAQKNFFCSSRVNTVVLYENFLFEDGNYWVSIEGGNENILFLNRFRSPELPYPKNIIALDIMTGKKLWENEEYVYYFCEKDKLYGRKSSFEKDLYAVINLTDGSASPLSDNDAAKLKKMKADADDDLFREFYDYPKPDSAYPADEECAAIIAKETGGKIIKGDVEYITKNEFLLFNYYVESDSTPETGRKMYRNVFCIYNVPGGDKLYGDVLNENSNYNVPDNFFIKEGRVLLLKGRENLVSINLVKK